nr:MAG TPA: ubiquitin thioesterase [Caudoviricetes sp.]
MPPFPPDPSTFTLKPKHTSVRSNRMGVCFYRAFYERKDNSL